MYQITKIAEEKGLTRSGCAEQIKKALEIYKLPDNSNLPIDVLTDAISLDKKNLNNHLNVVLLHDIGDSYVYPTDFYKFKIENVARHILAPAAVACDIYFVRRSAHP